MMLRPSSGALAGITFLCLFLAACVAKETPPPPDEVTCAAGEQKLDDGRCQPAGLPLDMPCPPGETPLEDGSCQAAGVPPAQCGDGFTADGESGCTPILPEAPCPDGMMAVPGETACREVAPCGDGPWGDIPIEADTQFVDNSYPGADSDGSQAKPWKTIQEGVNAAAKGAIVAIAAGTYQEDVAISYKPRRLWGRCPAMVTIEGVQPMNAAVAAFVSGAEVRGVAITGPSAGLIALNANSMLVEAVWIHDTGEFGLVALHPSTMTVRGSLIERTIDVGAQAWGASLEIERTVIRDVHGLGLSLDGSPEEGGTRPKLTVRSSLLEQIRRTAVNVMDTDLTVEDVAIRGLASGGPKFVVPVTGMIALTSSAAVRRTTFEALHAGIVVDTGTEAVIEQVTVANSSTPPLGPIWVAGILVQHDPAAGPPPHSVIRQSAVTGQPQYGIAVLYGSATIESTLVRDNVRDLGHDSGVDAQDADVTILHSVILDNAHLGLSLGSATGVLDSSVVRGVRPTGDSGDCVASRRVVNGSNAPSSLLIRSSVIEDCVETGVITSESEMAIEGSLVRGVKSRDDGRFGDGIAALSQAAERPATLKITGVRVEEVARSGVSAFGGAVSIGFSAVSCAKFDLVGEDVATATFSFEKLGDNLCGCPDPVDLCKVDSPGLTPPELH